MRARQPAALFSFAVSCAYWLLGNCGRSFPLFLSGCQCLCPFFERTCTHQWCSLALSSIIIWCSLTLACSVRSPRCLCPIFIFLFSFLLSQFGISSSSPLVTESPNQFSVSMCIWVVPAFSSLVSGGFFVLLWVRCLEVVAWSKLKELFYLVWLLISFFIF